MLGRVVVTLQFKFDSGIMEEKNDGPSLQCGKNQKRNANDVADGLDLPKK